MSLELTTPAVLFPAISLLMLAYTNRFLHLSALIRELHAGLKPGAGDARVRAQIHNLRHRLALIRWMQMLGLLSLLGCTFSMSALFFGWPRPGEIFFTSSVILMAASLLLSLREVQMSGGALNILLQDLEQSSGDPE